MEFKINQVIAVLYYHLLESKRNYQIILTNLALPILFFLTSLIVENNSYLELKELRQLIYSQFLSSSLLFGILTFSFSMPLQDNVEALEEGKLDMLKKTDLEYFNYLIGGKLSYIVLLNLHILFVILLFSSLQSITELPILKILLLVNLSFFAMNPFSYLIANRIKSVKLANNIGVLVMLVLLFSLTFTKMFSNLTTLDLSILNKILIINPMFGFYDSLNTILLRQGSFYFGSEYKNLLYMLFYAILITVIEYFNSRGKGVCFYGK